MKQAPLGEQAGDLGDVGERGAGLVVRGSAVISSGVTSTQERPVESICDSKKGGDEGGKK